ncbi:MAG TPA: ligase-associated DNA damage response DEXH box helicase [Methylibium sp.]|uniref:ligase-associated DNA damage response DEXH box helicase n=1 Tax=Methylibium sp. TaxID=2067992 RepID=UPI002DB55724|nr:ligase-associated DNA damage response DEXH box helicase [Methylibium sp.]HEU4458835.1 ligase-associated DNA damage response DEXH box helicase [Methylibium sp.]
MTTLQAAEAWFARRDWQPFAFQREVWAAMAAGRDGLLHATTGAGKTYAVWFGALARAADVGHAGASPAAAGEGGQRRAALSAQARAPALQVLWLTPMRALAADTLKAIALPLAELAPRWSCGLRTGDTPPAERARQDRRMPTALVTTPESLTLMLTREAARDELAGIHTVIVDEWHELMGNKRGVQVQLALARLKRWNPRLAVWGLSATLGNLEQAAEVLCGHANAQLVRGRIDKQLVIDTLLPHEPGRFSWAGHLGAQMLLPLIDELAQCSTAIVFTNVRSQAEIWYQLILRERPDWAGSVALHHGSLDKATREWVEAALKAGSLRAVVATSSLDLGVDFLPVERVIQIGSAKGIARLLQRAGRSGHQPGRPSRITLVPTNTLELVEAAAARHAAQAGRIEKRESPQQPLDVLVQHLVSMAIGGGFEAEAMYDEVRGAHAYRDLPRASFQWALDFVERGGASLGAYPEYHRVRLEGGVYRVPDRAVARRHKLAIGTIVSDSSMLVKWMTGGTIGTIEEGFIARLNKGDCFVFAGKLLEYVRTQDMAAYVRKPTRKSGVITSWAGSKMPLSTELADAVLERMQAADQGDFFEPELQAARPMLATQAKVSKLPTPSTLLVERFDSRDGHHLYLYPFAGRHVHLGLASLLAWRLSKQQPNTFSLSYNDYGFELMSALPIDIASVLDHSVFATGALLEDVLASLNSSELARRRFREIARISGLVFSGYPGAPKSLKQVQASSSLFYEVFRKYDANNLLLSQAESEVLSQELDIRRLRASLQSMAGKRIELVTLAMPSPLCLPLMVERFREQLTTEKLNARLERMLQEMNAAIDAPPSPRKTARRSAPRKVAR